VSRDVVYVRDLRSLIGGWTVNVIGARISENARLQCARKSRCWYYSDYVRATEEDHDRWHAATEDLLATIRALQDTERQVSLHLHPPFQGRLWWHLRYVRRNWLLHKNYDREVAKLRAKFDAALAAYQDQAGDLPAYVEQYKRQEQERLKREKRRARLRRAEAMETAAEPQWSYGINDDSDERSFWIYLTSLDPFHGDGGLTPTEVQAALAAERAEYPYTSVMWGAETGRALKEKYKTETEVSGWKALTGELIVSHPRDPSRPQPYAKYHAGPSSTYGCNGSTYGSDRSTYGSDGSTYGSDGGAGSYGGFG
jgi:hypothetical protein